MGPRFEIADAALFHRGEAVQIEAGAKPAAFAGQNHRAEAPFLAEPLGRGDERIEHRRVERIHLVGARQPNIGNATRNIHGNSIGHRPPLSSQRQALPGAKAGI